MFVSYLVDWAYNPFLFSNLLGVLRNLSNSSWSNIASDVAALTLALSVEKLKIRPQLIKT